MAILKRVGVSNTTPKTTAQAPTNDRFSELLSSKTQINGLRSAKYKQTTYNDNFPWLNETSYKKLESAVDKLWLTWEEKETAMNQWYRQNVKYLLNDQTLNERAKEINEQAYQAAEIKNPQADAQLRMTEFSQALKKKYNLDATANDLDVFNTFVSNLWEEWINLAWQYLAWENKKLRYDAGLETWWEKAADFWVWVLQSPWKRGYNMWGQWRDKLGHLWAEKILGHEIATDEDTFKGREATDIRTPILWEERANSTATKVGEVVWDIASWIALTAPIWAALAPTIAWSSIAWAASLWALEWAVDTALTQYWTQGDLNASLWQWALGIGGWAVGWLLTRYLANLPAKQVKDIKKEASWYIEKSIKPTVKWKQNQVAYDKFVDDTLDVTDYMSKNKKILEYTDDAWNVVRWELPNNLRETSEALWNMKKYIYDQYNDIAKKAWDAGARVNLNKLYNKLDDLEREVWPNLANTSLVKEIERFKNQLLQYTDDAWTIAIKDAQDTMQYYNKLLDAYFKNPWAYANDASKNIVVANLKRGLADAVDDSLDDVLNKSINNGSTASEQYRYWKQLYSKIKTIEDEVSKRALVEARKNAKWLSTDIIDALAWGDIVEWLLTQSPTGFAKWAVMKAINAYNKYLNNPNTQIKNLFNLVDSINNPSVISSNLAQNVWRETLENIWGFTTAAWETIGQSMYKADETIE